MDDEIHALCRAISSDQPRQIVQVKDPGRVSVRMQHVVVETRLGARSPTRREPQSSTYLDARAISVRFGHFPINLRTD
jgi:hypothetical protein